MTDSDWIAELRRQTKLPGRSQVAVARELGLSGPLISQVLGGTYPGNLARIEDLVRGRYMQAEVSCPVFGFDIRTDQCRQYQERKHGAVNNHYAARLQHTCPTCPNYKP